MVDIAVGHARCPDEVEHAFLPLQVHRQALQAVGDFAEDGLAREPADFLEVGELRDLHAVEPDFPAQAPGAERRRFPVVLDEADVVLFRFDPQVLEGIQVDLLDLGRRWLQHHLVLVIVLQPVWILAVAAVLRPARWLHISGFPGLGTDGAQEGRGMKRSRAHLHVVGLQQHASAAVPEIVQAEDELLEGQHRGCGFYRLRFAAAIKLAMARASNAPTSVGQSRRRT